MIDISGENVVLVGALLLFVAVMAGKVAYRFGAPALLLFLGVGMLFGLNFISFRSVEMTQFVGMIALCIILFTGGMDTSFQEIKPIIGPGVMLATVGVVMTAMVLAGFVWLVAPWLDLEISFALALLLAAVWQYRRAKALFTAWDGDAEDPIDQAESRLNWVLLFASVAMVLDFFLLTTSSYSQFPFGALIGVGAFLVIAAAIMIIQQKTVDLTRRINPEKQGSVYDVKFQKKWIDSCDEAEKKQIGQASYRAYRVTGNACLVLWVVLLILDFTFGIGVLPASVALLLWGILQVSYILECIRLSKREK